MPAESAAASSGRSAATDVAALTEEAWDAAMRISPLTATTLGDSRFHDELPDNSPSGLAGTERLLGDLRRRAAEVSDDVLDDEERITRSALVSFLDGQIAELVPT